MNDRYLHVSDSEVTEAKKVNRRDYEITKWMHRTSFLGGKLERGRNLNFLVGKFETGRKQKRSSEGGKRWFWYNDCPHHAHSRH